MRRTGAVIVALASLLVGAGVVTSPAGAAKAKCLAITPEQYDALELPGTNFTAGVAVAVPKKNRPYANWPRNLIALRVAKSKTPAVLAVGSIADDESIATPIDSLNQVALDTTGFGDGAQEGSAELTAREQLQGIPQVKQVQQCLADETGT